jgi:hypothetical protein
LVAGVESTGIAGAIGMGASGGASIASVILAEPARISIYWRQNRKKCLQMVNQSLITSEARSREPETT